MNNGKGNIGATIVQELNLGIETTIAGYQVSDPSARTSPQVVTIQGNQFVCDCVDFDEDSNCNHIRAVLSHLCTQTKKAFNESADNRQLTDASPATMTLRRSISPDGKIDSLAIEFSSPVDRSSCADITARALSMLKLQSVVANEFLMSKHAGRAIENNNGHSSQVLMANARMIRIGEVPTKRDRSLFLEFHLRDQGARLFGTSEELAQAVADAVYSSSPDDICDGLNLDVACQVLVKPSRNPLYTEILRVLPVDFSFPENSEPPAG
jgi:hypothetical protein